MARGDILLNVVVCLVLAILVLGWMIVRDEERQLNALSQKTQASWESIQTCLNQRNEILKLTLRLFSKEPDADRTQVKDIRERLSRAKALATDSFPPEELAFVERDLSKLIRLLLREVDAEAERQPKYEKIGDLLADSQNRLAFQRARYDRAAKPLKREMETLTGAAAARLLRISRPVIWGGIEGKNPE